MPRESQAETVDAVRRKLLKTTAVAGGFLAAGHLPYSKPAVRSFFGVRSAWAQPSGTTMAQFSGNLQATGPVGTGQDAYTFTTTAMNTMLTINVMITGGAAVPEIGLFAPGDPVTGTNIITGTGNGSTGPFPVVVNAIAVGSYTLAIEDNLSDGAEVSFSYQIDITAGAPIIPGGQVITDGPESLGPTPGG